MIDLTSAEFTRLARTVKILTLIGQEQSFADIADRVGCCVDTVENTLAKFVGEKRFSGEAVRYSPAIQQELKRLVRHGYTYSQTANILTESFGRRITKNAVSGFIFRNGKY